MEDYFENFKETKLKLLKNKDMREHMKNTVEKALNCENPKYRYIKYKCVSCNEEYIHGFSCKSKFCIKCGKMYSINWAEKQSQNMLNVKLAILFLQY